MPLFFSSLLCSAPDPHSSARMAPYSIRKRASDEVIVRKLCNHTSDCAMHTGTKTRTITIKVPPAPGSQICDIYSAFSLWKRWIVHLKGTYNKCMPNISSHGSAKSEVYAKLIHRDCWCWFFFQSQGSWNTVAPVIFDNGDRGEEDDPLLDNKGLHIIGMTSSGSRTG